MLYDAEFLLLVFRERKTAALHVRSARNLQHRGPGGSPRVVDHTQLADDVKRLLFPDGQLGRRERVEKADVAVKIRDMKPGFRLWRDVQTICHWAAKYDSGSQMAQIPSTQHPFSRQPVAHGGAIVPQLDIRIELGTSLDCNSVDQPGTVLAAGQLPPIVLEIRYDEGRWQDANKINLGSFPHGESDDNDPIVTV